MSTSMRAVIYARYSTDLQRATGIDDQIRLCREHVDREGWRYLHAYADRATSGASRLRAGYQKLIEDARNGEFDVVVAEALDRLSRDQEDVAALYKRLRFAGVKLITVAEGEITELHVGLKGTMNALFLKDLADKTRRGLRGRVEAGRSGGGLCYGYDVVRQLDPNGELVRGARRINEADATVVRSIFNDFATGLSPRAITFKLNAANVPAPGGQAWGASTINGNVARGTGILNNELYVGRLIWNRLRYVKDPETGKRISRSNPESALVIHEVPELRIIDQELWNRVKRRQREVKRDTRPDVHDDRPLRARRRPRHLFSGLMKCGHCGGAYTKISASLFGCATARNKGTCKNRVNIRTDALEATVLDGLRTRLMDPELFRAFVEEFAREFNRLISTQHTRVDQAKAELAKVERRTRKIVDAIAEGVSARTLKEELLGLEARQDQLKADIASAKAPGPFMHPNLAEVYRRKVAELHMILQDETKRAEAMEQIRALVEGITITPDAGGLRVELKGELAGILQLASAQKGTAASEVGSGRLAEQVKVVAGIGFEPMTFRL